MQETHEFAYSNTAVVGITSLDYDHVDILGCTMEEIAWQKAGIIKPGSVVVCSPDQPVSALKVICQRAEERKVMLPWALQGSPVTCTYMCCVYVS